MSARRTVGAIADVLGTLAMVVWVGGHAALGAFAARIAFRTLPRAEAAQTMTQVFHSFDHVIAIAIVVLLVAAAAGAWARGFGGPAQVRLGVELALCALGAFELFRVHARIEAMFAAGETLSPAFLALHRLSERCAHVEALLVVAALIARAWPSREPTR